MKKNPREKHCYPPTTTPQPISQRQPLWACLAAALSSYLLVFHLCVHVCSVVSALCDLMDCSRPGFCVLGIPQQESWSGLPFPPPGDLPDTGVKSASPVSLALAGRFFTTAPPQFSTLSIVYCDHLPLTLYSPLLPPPSFKELYFNYSSDDLLWVIFEYLTLQSHVSWLHSLSSTGILLGRICFVF